MKEAVDVLHGWPPHVDDVAIKNLSVLLIEVDPSLDWSPAVLRLEQPESSVTGSHSCREILAQPIECLVSG